MTALRKPLLFGLAALGLLTSLTGCVVAERPGRYHGDYVAEGPNWHPHHWNNNWHGNGGDGWQGNGGNWNHYN